MYTGGLEGLQYMYAVIYRLGQIKHMGLYCCTFDKHHKHAVTKCLY